VNILLPEFEFSPEELSLAPRHVSISLTNACDLHCDHCFAPKHSASLDFDFVTSCLHELDQHGCFGVGFGGGEPTLYPRFAELCRYASQFTDLAVTFTTHGHHLRGELARELGGHVNFIRVSMDGVGKVYDGIRGRGFCDLLKRIETVKQIAKFGINYVVNEMTIGDLDSAVKIARGFGASEFLLLPQQQTPDADAVDRKTSKKLKEWVQSYRGDLSLVVSEAAAAELPTCSPFEGEDALRAFAHIDADAALKSTSYDATGVRICAEGVMSALERLRRETPEVLK